ncbi:MAG: proprotein convertase P-domain-containing protein [Verrucomicrobiaceae bacterium]|nr:proprotein convertase P-domain-containing protein [Verrucomicrobiaceae bacterium]
MEKYVLYQCLLVRPCGSRKVLATGPRRTSSRAVTVNWLFPAKSVVGSQVSWDWTLRLEDKRPSERLRVALVVISPPAVSVPLPRST